MYRVYKKMSPSQREYVKWYWKTKNAVGVERRCRKECGIAVRTRVRNARLHRECCSCVAGLDSLQRQCSPDTCVNKPRVHRIVWHEKWKKSVPSGPNGISRVGYCAERERSPDFIVRFDNATCGLAGFVIRHSYLYWPPDFTQLMYRGCQCGAVCLQSTGKAISPCSKCPGCCLLISPAGQHFAFRL